MTYVLCYQNIFFPYLTLFFLIWHTNPQLQQAPITLEYIKEFLPRLVRKK